MPATLKNRATRCNSEFHSMKKADKMYNDRAQNSVKKKEDKKNLASRLSPKA